MARWWHEDPALEAIEAQYGPVVDGTDPTDARLVLLGDRPVGFLQRYRFADNPEFIAELAPLTPVSPRAISLDYLLGEPESRGRGVGSRMLALAVTDGWDRFPDVDEVVVPVAAGNRASWRALERAGFERIAEGPLEPDNPIDPPDHVVYRVRRPSAPTP